MGLPFVTLYLLVQSQSINDFRHEAADTADKHGLLTHYHNEDQHKFNSGMSQKEVTALLTISILVISQQKARIPAPHRKTSVPKNACNLSSEVGAGFQPG